MVSRFALVFAMMSILAAIGCGDSSSDDPSFAQMMQSQDQCEAACNNMQTQCGLVSNGCVQACTANLSPQSRQCIAAATSCDATEWCTTDDRVAEVTPAASTTVTR